MRIEEAAIEIINKVHAYMREHPESELHRQGKMFGVLTYDGGYLAAFSAKLDGSYHHEGFVGPVYEMRELPVGNSKTESQRLQRLLFAEYRFLNRQGESKNLLEIFANEKPILSPEEWFMKGQRDNVLCIKDNVQGTREYPLPPSGAGECCGPKLLQEAFRNGIEPKEMAEFWVGAPSRTEIRREGVFYAPCSGKCVPILRHMLAGTEIRILTDAPQRGAAGTSIKRLYEDEYLLVVEKPEGLLSVPGKGDEPSVASILTDECGYPVMPVHRLDQDTSGILVVAKKPEIYKSLQAYFQRRDIYKRYEALINVQGDNVRCTKEEGVISLPLLPNPYDRPRQMVDLVHGKPAVTRYAIRERRADGTMLVDFYPETGRTHQLRVHAAHPDGLDAPIVGDRLYGLSIPISPDGKENRLMLHAAEIRFRHPVTQEEMHFCIPSHF
ncbi:MAG: RluA family pseudouridine synthase [Paludibacteraceae bacterium]|nr:RluA family pseudouridine synthase [Paludibacteraceae bacterium]